MCLLRFVRPKKRGKSMAKHDFTGRRLTIEDIENGVDAIFSDRMKHMNYSVQLDFYALKDDSVTFFDSAHPVGSRLHDPLHIYIGTKSLVDGIDEFGHVRDEDAVRVFMHTYHECFHAWARGVGYMRSANATMPGIKDMARDRALDICFRSYGRSMYMIDAEEINADLSAVRGIRSFFDQMSKRDSRYGLVDLDGIVVDIATRRHGRSWDDLSDCHTVDDVVTAYTNMSIVAPFRKRFDVMYLSTHCDDDKRMQILLQNTDFTLSVANAPTGIEQTDMLCRYAGALYPDCFRSLPCVGSDYKVENIRNYGETIVQRLLGVKPLYDNVPSNLPDDYSPDV